MKWLKWIASLAIVLIALAIGSIYFLFDSTLQKLKPEIVNTMAKSLGTEVTIGGISAQILPSPKIELSSLAIGGDNGAKFNRLFIDTSISELLSGKFVISDISIQDPSAEIIKLEDGSFQIGKLKLGQKNEAIPVSPTTGIVAPAEPNQKAIGLNISKLSVINGNFTYQEVAKAGTKLSPEINRLNIDGSINGQINVESKADGLKIDLNFDATSAGIKFERKESEILLNKAQSVPLKLSVAAELTPTKIFHLQECKLKLQDSIITTTSEINLEDKASPIKSLNLVLDKVSVSDLNKFVTIPTITSGSMSGDLKIEMNKKPLPEIEGVIEIVGVNLDSLNIAQFGGKLLFKRNLISTDLLSLNYKNENITVSGDLLSYTGNNLNTPNLNVKALGGTILIQNSYLNEGDNPFSGSISGGGIDLKRLVVLATSLPPYSVAGNLAKLSASFRGTVTNLKRDLSATTSIAVSRGEILGVNLIGGAFQKIRALPGIEDSLVRYIPEQYQSLITNSSATSFDSLSIDASLSSGTEINLSKAELTHPAYLIYGSGKASTTGTLELRTQMKITKVITDGMVAKNQKLQLLLDKDDNLSFPLLISKENGSLVVLPDVTELGKNALRNSTKEATSKALDKVAPGLGKGASKLLNKLF